MENINKPDSQPNDTTAEQKKKNYHTPKLHHYGGLAELVQFNPSRGADGETFFVDCTSA